MIDHIMCIYIIIQDRKSFLELFLIFAMENLKFTIYA